MLRWNEPDELDSAWHDALLGPGCLFELVDEEVLGSTLPVFAQRPRSLREVLVRAAEQHGDRPYLVGPERTVTFADAPARADAVASVLRATHGVQPGDRVVLAGGFSLEHALALWGVVAAGAIATTCNPGWTTPELTHALSLSSPALVLGDPGVLDRLVPALPASPASGGDALRAPRSPAGAPRPPVVAFADVVTEADRLASPGSPVQPQHPAPLPPGEEDDPFAIVFTSGTTGRPKGATLSHRNAVHFSLAAAAAAAVHSIVHALPAAGDGPPTSIASAPLFHVSGLLGQLTNSAFWGMTIVIPPAGRWDESVHLDLTQRHRVTSWSIVPTQLWRLVEHPDLASYDLSSLSVIGGGGATFAPELLRRTGERLPHVATSLRVGYGMTETAGTVTMLQPPFPEAHRDSVGTPVAGTEIEIRDTTGRPLPDGEIGEIWARGAQVFLGYWDDEAATSAALDAGRWYATGDFGRVDEGFLHLESRLRDLIIRGGENIYPIEIENRLAEHPAIAEAAVVGVGHPSLGQEVKAVCVVREGATVTADEARAWVGDVLARYKVPAVVEFCDELPRNETGKVLKQQLT